MSINKIAYRIGQPEDSEAILLVHMASILILGRAAYNEKQCASWAHGLDHSVYSAAMENGKHFTVAICDEKVIAFSSHHNNEILAFFVHPEFAHAGVGRQLLGIIEAKIFADNKDRIILSAALSAVPFYTSCGYIIECNDTWVTRGGDELGCCQMSKSTISL